MAEETWEKAESCFLIGPELQYQANSQEYNKIAGIRIFCDHVATVTVPYIMSLNETDSHTYKGQSTF